MKKEYRKELPRFIDDDLSDYGLILTDDLDSLLSCYLLNQVKGCNISTFYSFEEFYYSEIADSKKMIGVDMAMVRGKCFDNHVTKNNANDYYNLQSVNINNINVSRTNYTKKYAMSTVLLIYSIYDIPLPEAELGKMLLLCIDSGFLGYYSGFKATHLKWLEILELDELIPVLEKYDRTDFERLNGEYRLKSKVYMDNNKLQTDIELDELNEILDMDIQMPELSFEKLDMIQFENKSSKIKRRSNIKKEKYFSLAFTSKDKVKYTKLHKVG